MAPPTPTPTTDQPPSTDATAHKLDSSIRQCFICLQNSTEDPSPFVNPCPCTLEAHESCLLRWLAESETSSSTSTRNKPLRCPACHARIGVDQPSDPVVAVRDVLSRGFSSVSPYILLTLVLTGGAVGSGWYGLMSAHLFAGPAAAVRWLGVRTLLNRRPDVGLWRWAPLWKFTVKIWALSLIGPGLVLGRAVPAVGNLLLIPCSMLSAAFLVAWDDMPSWPPSPAWAVTLFPFVSLTYSNIYYEFFGPLEKRLNRALRAIPPNEDQQDVPRRDDADAIAAGAGEGDDEHNEQGIFASIWGLGQAVFGLFRDQEVVVEAHVHVGGEVDRHDGDNNGGAIEVEFDGDIFGEEDAEAIVEALEEAIHNEEPPAEGHDDAQPVPQQQQQAQLQAQNNNDAAAGGGGQENNRGVNSTLNDIMSSIALSLLYPTICFGMGEALRVALPKSWVTRPFGWGRTPTGLLQYRWGRSLVGGCLYVVLKDAFSLYAKYRQVLVKSKRRIRNVERRRPN